VTVSREKIQVKHTIPWTGGAPRSAKDCRGKEIERSHLRAGSGLRSRVTILISFRVASLSPRRRKKDRALAICIPEKGVELKVVDALYHSIRGEKGERSSYPQRKRGREKEGEKCRTRGLIKRW